LLLVMIVLVICSILTAGFLASQGTSIGIARNERDAEKAKAIARSGIDMCYWLMRNRTDWRLAMSPGPWLRDFAVGEGTVTVTAATADGNHSFATDTTQAVVFTSTGSYNNRTFTLTATIGPTGGGEVFRNGNYILDKITLGPGSPVIDSIGTLTNNAKFSSGCRLPAALTVYTPARYNGSYTIAKDANMSNAVHQTVPAMTSINTSQASLVYMPGRVIPPNTAGLNSYGPLTRTSGTTPLTSPGRYDSLTINATSPAILNITASGTYHIAGNLTMTGNATINIQPASGGNPVHVILLIDGNLAMTGNSIIRAVGNCTLKIYLKGDLTCLGSNSAITAVATSNLLLLCVGPASTFTFSSSGSSSGGSFSGAIYAPTADVILSNSATLKGAIVAKSLTMTDSTVFHHDTTPTFQDVRVGHLIGGSAPSGFADYTVSIVGSTPR